MWGERFVREWVNKLHLVYFAFIEDHHILSMSFTSLKTFNTTITIAIIIISTQETMNNTTMITFTKIIMVIVMTIVNTSTTINTSLI